MCVASLQGQRVSVRGNKDAFKPFGLNPESAVTALASRFQSDHYGFVTFYNMNDAFAAIDNGSKLRRPDELPFDLCFGGRRQFCNSDYADLGETISLVSQSVLCLVACPIKARRFCKPHYRNHHAEGVDWPI